MIATNADPDETLHYAAFHLVLHCLPKNLFAGIQNGYVQFPLCR